MTRDFTIISLSILLHVFDTRRLLSSDRNRFQPGLTVFILIYSTLHSILLLCRAFQFTPILIYLFFFYFYILFIYSIYSIVLVYFTLIYSFNFTLATRDFTLLFSYSLYSTCLTHDTFYLFNTISLVFYFY